MTDPRARDKCLELGPRASRQDIEKCLRDYTYFTSAKEQRVREGVNNSGHLKDDTLGIEEENGVNLLYGSAGQWQGSYEKGPEGHGSYGGRWKPRGDYTCFGCNREQKPTLRPWWECRTHYPRTIGVTQDPSKKSDTMFPWTIMVEA